MTGRKRKSGPRNPNGRLSTAGIPRNQTPTQEAIMRKTELIGGADPVLAENPLAILYARGIITADQREAGYQLAALRRRAGMPSPHSRAASLADHVHSSLTTADAGSTREDNGAFETYKAACAALRNAGRRAYDGVINAAIEERLPGWFTRAHARGADNRDRAELIAGLNTMAHWFGLTGRAAA